jgi:hypothetical protein
LQRKAEVLGEKPVPVLLCVSQIPHVLVWDQTPGLRGERSATTASAMARASVVDLQGG